MVSFNKDKIVEQLKDKIEAAAEQMQPSRRGWFFCEIIGKSGQQFGVVILKSCCPTCAAKKAAGIAGEVLYAPELAAMRDKPTEGKSFEYDFNVGIQAAKKESIPREYVTNRFMTHEEMDLLVERGGANAIFHTPEEFAAMPPDKAWHVVAFIDARSMENVGFYMGEFIEPKEALLTAADAFSKTNLPRHTSYQIIGGYLHYQPIEQFVGRFIHGKELAALQALTNDEADAVIRGDRELPQ